MRMLTLLLSVLVIAGTTIGLSQRAVNLGEAYIVLAIIITGWYISETIEKHSKL